MLNVETLAKVLAVLFNPASVMSRGAACLRPSRERPALHRWAQVRGRARPLWTCVLESGRDTSLRAAVRTRLPTAIQSLNARWQAKVWQRFHHDSPADVCPCSSRYVLAYGQPLASRLDAPPARRRFPAQWPSPTAEEPQGRVVYVRRTDAEGVVPLLGYRLVASHSWPHRVVRCEAAFPTGRVTSYALHRRDPAQQPLLRTTRIRWCRRWTGS